MKLTNIITTFLLLLGVNFIPWLAYLVFGKWGLFIAAEISIGFILFGIVTYVMMEHEIRQQQEAELDEQWNDILSKLTEDQLESGDTNTLPDYDSFEDFMKKYETQQLTALEKARKLKAEEDTKDLTNVLASGMIAKVEEPAPNAFPPDSYYTKDTPELKN